MKDQTRNQQIMIHHLTKHVIISIDTEAFEKTPYPFLKKTLSKAEIEGNFLHLIIYEKSAALITHLRRTECFHLKIKNKMKMSSLITSTNNVLKILLQCSKQEQEIKGIQIGKKVLIHR